MSRARSHSRGARRAYGDSSPWGAAGRPEGSASPARRRLSQSPDRRLRRREWETALQEVGAREGDPMQLYELLVHERDPQRFLRRLREAQEAVEGRQRALEGALQELEQNGRKHRCVPRSRSRPDHRHGEGPGAAPRPAANGAAPRRPPGSDHPPPAASPAAHRRRPTPPRPRHRPRSADAPGADVPPPRPGLQPWSAAPPGPGSGPPLPPGALPLLPFEDVTLAFQQFVQQLQAMQAGPTVPNPVLSRMPRPGTPSLPLPPASLSSQPPPSDSVPRALPGPLALMTPLQPLAMACHNGRPLPQQPILNFKDPDGRLLLWSQPVEASVTLARLAGSVRRGSIAVRAMGTIALPNCIGLAIFTHLGFVGEVGAVYCITFRSHGAEDLAVEGIEVLPDPSPAEDPLPSSFPPTDDPGYRPLASHPAGAPPTVVVTAAPNGRPPERRPSEETLASAMHTPHSLTRRAAVAHSRSLSFPRQHTTAPPAVSGAEDGFLARRWKRKGKVKTNRLGGEVYKGHPSHHIMQAMKEGIITSVRYASTLPLRPLTAATDFGSSSIRRKYRKSTHPKLGGAAMTIFEATLRRKGTTRVSRGFHFCDYNPTVFRQIRECFGIDTATYTRSLSDVWTTVKTPGKSRALLYFAGNQFVIKTLTKPESTFLRSILLGYTRHVQANPSTLLTRFYGHHCLTSLANNKRIRFVVMNNVFQTENYIHTKYDLKGSTYGRAASEQDKQSGSCIYKDLDFEERKLWIGPTRRGLFLTQVRRDVEFLKRMSVMDYSMLVGIHEAEAPTQPQEVNTRSAFVSDEGGMGSHTKAEIYYIGIIDILQDFNLWKRAEYTIRSIIHDKKTISAVPPKAYAARFLAFIEQQVK